MKFLGIDHVQIAIPSGNESIARDFYVGVLGLREIPKPEILSGRGGFWLECGAQQLHIGVERDFTSAKKAHPALIVDDLLEFIRVVGSHGVVALRGEDLAGVRRAFVADPFGNRIEVMEFVDGVSTT